MGYWLLESESRCLCLTCNWVEGEHNSIERSETNALLMHKHRRKMD